MKPLIEFAIDSGLRLEEQLSLEWSQVDLDHEKIRVIRTKIDAPRAVPLLPRSAQILAQLKRKRGSRYVFCKKDGTRYYKLTRGLAGTAKRANIANLRWHDLRRTCGCRLLQDYGLGIYKVRDWLGHKLVTVTERTYAFNRAEDLHAALAKREAA